MLDNEGTAAKLQDFHIARNGGGVRLEFPVPNSPVPIMAVCHAPGEFDWSLKGLVTEDFKLRLIERLALDGISGQVFAPRTPDMAGTIVEPSNFAENIPLPFTVPRISLRRNANVSSLVTKKAIVCDGTYLAPGQTFLMSAGGCPVLIATGGTAKNPITIVAHCGRDSAIDHLRVMSDGTRSSRHDMSVVDSMARTSIKLGVPPKELRLFCLFQIDPIEFPHHFNHPRFGEINEKRVQFVQKHYGSGIFQVRDGVHHLDMGKLVERQAELAGFGAVDTNSRVLPQNREYPYTRHNDPLRAAWRSLVVVSVGKRE